MKVFNKTTGTVIALKGKVADTFLSRLTGLINRASLLQEETLIITRCQSIHMFFMRFSIDVVFVNKKNCVVGLVERIKPFKLSPIFFNASYAIELPEGKIAEKKITIGDIVELRNE